MVETGFDEFAFEGLDFDQENLDLASNCGKGKCFPGGPECEFMGKKNADAIILE